MQCPLFQSDSLNFPYWNWRPSGGELRSKTIIYLIQFRTIFNFIWLTGRLKDLSLKWSHYFWIWDFFFKDSRGLIRIWKLHRNCQLPFLLWDSRCLHGETLIILQVLLPLLSEGSPGFDEWVSCSQFSWS